MVDLPADAPVWFRNALWRATVAQSQYPEIDLQRWAGLVYTETSDVNIWMDDECGHSLPFLSGLVWGVERGYISIAHVGMFRVQFTYTKAGRALFDVLRDLV